jgi:predicted RNase H-like HicB family nuclease
MKALKAAHSLHGCADLHLVSSALLPGCIAAAATCRETVDLIQEGIEFHIEGMILHGERVPAPTTLAELVEIN